MKKGVEVEVGEVKVSVPHWFIQSTLFARGAFSRGVARTLGANTQERNTHVK